MGYPLFHLSRIPDFVIGKVMELFVAKTRQAKRDALKPDPFDFSVQYARELLVFAIGLCYSTMSPIILPFTMIYFALSYFVAKHNFIFVFNPRYDGIRMTHAVIDRIFIAIILYQLIILGVFTLSRFTGGVAVALAVTLTIGFRWWLGKKFYVSSKFLAMEDCVSNKEEAKYMKFDSSVFLDPSLIPLPSMDDRNYHIATDPFDGVVEMEESNIELLV